MDKKALYELWNKISAETKKFLKLDLKVPTHSQLGVVDCRMKHKWQYMSS